MVGRKTFLGKGISYLKSARQEKRVLGETQKLMVSTEIAWDQIIRGLIDYIL